jgi:hypothetical protein
MFISISALYLFITCGLCSQLHMLWRRRRRRRRRILQPRNVGMTQLKNSPRAAKKKKARAHTHVYTCTCTMSCIHIKTGPVLGFALLFQIKLETFIPSFPQPFSIGMGIFSSKSVAATDTGTESESDAETCATFLLHHHRLLCPCPCCWWSDIK